MSVMDTAYLFALVFTCTWIWELNPSTVCPAAANTEQIASIPSMASSGFPYNHKTIKYFQNTQIYFTSFLNNNRKIYDEFEKLFTKFITQIEIWTIKIKNILPKFLLSVQDHLHKYHGGNRRFFELRKQHLKDTTEETLYFKNWKMPFTENYLLSSVDLDFISSDFKLNPPGKKFKQISHRTSRDISSLRAFGLFSLNLDSIALFIGSSLVVLIVSEMYFGIPWGLMNIFSKTVCQRLTLTHPIICDFDIFNPVDSDASNEEDTGGSNSGEGFTESAETSEDNDNSAETSEENNNSAETSEDNTNSAETSEDNGNSAETNEDSTNSVATNENNANPAINKDNTNSAETSEDNTNSAETSEDNTNSAETSEDNTNSAETSENNTNSSETSADNGNSAETSENKTNSAETTENNTNSAETSEDYTNSAETSENNTNSAETSEDYTNSAETSENNTNSAETSEDNINSAETSEDYTNSAETSENNTNSVETNEDSANYREAHGNSSKSSEIDTGNKV